MDNLSEVSTNKLIDELKTRKGVTEIISAPYLEYEVKTSTQKIKREGPATILVIED